KAPPYPVRAKMVAGSRTPSIEDDIDQLKFFTYPANDINDNECLLSSAVAMCSTVKLTLFEGAPHVCILELTFSEFTTLFGYEKKVKMREHVIEQLEEEIQAKQRLIYEQGHLIHILENENRVDE
ncbi:hypothetical protein TELCIR_13661, partial [Teladorsagia circumcincta]